MTQGTDEWKEARLGKVSASRLLDITRGPKGYKAARKNYMAEKACEILTGNWEEMYTTTPMQRGIDLEPMARTAYEVRTGNIVDIHPGMDHPLIKNFWGSPDGLIALDGGFETKCPNTATHISTLSGAKIKPGYILQCQGNMMVFDRKWWDFVSYDDRLPDNLSMFIQRIPRDEVVIAELTIEINLFNADLFALVERLRKWQVA